MQCRIDRCHGVQKLELVSETKTIVGTWRINQGTHAAIDHWPSTDEGPSFYTNSVKNSDDPLRNFPIIEIMHIYIYIHT